MLDIFKRNADRPVDVKTIRDTLLQFIKDRLKKSEGGEGNNIIGMQIFISCEPEEKHLYEAVVYIEDTERFKNEVQKIADDYAIELPDIWSFETIFTETLPADALKIPNLDAALLILTRQRAAQQIITAYIKIRVGEAEKEIYKITSNGGKICIGRERRVQTADGFYRENKIAFPEANGNESNKFVSRQHAHLEFDNDLGCFLLFADEGGVPPRNKIKIRTASDANPIKLYTTKIGHPLQEGDQILLGQSALLEFSYKEEENNL
ncbi:MAG TPA: hypothetical protein VNA26_08660 [Chitinophagaceae bacterium]|nr:hypothetical protein [Chitinophagaceae bacterium]